jgi:hypothetical protein
MNQRELGDYSVEKTLRNLYRCIYAPFLGGKYALGLCLTMSDNICIEQAGFCRFRLLNL